ncbi:hypothetical protein [Brevibacterium sp. UCMA 11752]|uniref:hypothetical protein n=1 Tax=Brevibacterium sp. UCMA 11752 TaxID=2745946 RepID=UPI001F19CC7A|nr:hypothetical protein [Brevibacterium sp. UCMA 11752]MCF2587561.1 hypothetical protein [Brevibacterium sp. UCMA 11752]
MIAKRSQLPLTLTFSVKGDSVITVVEEVFASSVELHDDHRPSMQEIDTGYEATLRIADFDLRLEIEDSVFEEPNCDNRFGR